MKLIFTSERALGALRRIHERSHVSVTKKPETPKLSEVQNTPLAMLSNAIASAGVSMQQAAKSLDAHHASFFALKEGEFKRGPRPYSSRRPDEVERG